MVTKTVWAMVLITGGVLDDCCCKPLVKTELVRFWNKSECINRVEKYEAKEGKEKLRELSGGRNYLLTCLEREVAVIP